MRPGVTIFLTTAIFILGGVLASAPPARAQGNGTFVVISDIHFNPFAAGQPGPTLAASPPTTWRRALAPAMDQAMSPIGEDTNYALLVSSLAAFANAMARADFAVIPGDLLVHDFDAKAAKALGIAPRSQATYDLATNTALFVADELAKALAGKPAIVALGNVDSGCGDYHIDPGGRFLAATREAVRRLVGAERVAPDFDETYAAGGYYAARHPTVANGLIVVLNDVLWSRHYRDGCGSHGLAAAKAMLHWLRDLLAQQRAVGGRVWMVHHIPWGMDPFSTLTNQAPSCAAKVVPFLNEPFATEFPALLAAYHDVLQTSLSGHTHFDDYRLMIDERGTALAVDKLVPAVSPIFGQNPAFQVFTYDRASGTPGDFSTWYLSNPGQPRETADWRFEYTFTRVYGQPRYSAPDVDAVWKSLRNDGATQDTYRRLYGVGRDHIRAADLSAYWCAIGHLSRPAFTACYCGEQR